MAEMTFADWPAGKPRIVGYGAKWDEESDGWRQTVRRFGVEKNEPALAARLKADCEAVWDLFGLTGFVRVDFRVTETGEPLMSWKSTSIPASPRKPVLPQRRKRPACPMMMLIEEIVKAAL